jgi:tetratricopeptide (TPR) repeat protein
MPPRNLIAIIFLFISISLAQNVLCADNPEMHYQLGNESFVRGDYEKAIQEYNKVLAMGLQRKEIYNNLGLAYARSPEGYVNAIENFKKAIEIEPAYVDAYINLGSVYIKKGQYKEAAAAFRQSVSVKPDSGNGYFGLGWSNLIGKINVIESLEAFKMAAKINPGSPQVQFGLGLAYVAAGKKQMALEPITALRKMERGDLANMIEEAIRTGAIIQEDLQKENLLKGGFEPSKD